MSQLCHLVFVETRTQAIWIKAHRSFDPQTKLVAVTAEALQALEECGLPHQAISEYADTRLFAAEYDRLVAETYHLAQDVESFIMDRCADVKFDGPGFLTGQVYYLACVAVPALATRALLLCETIRACAPTQVSIWGDAMAPWFIGEREYQNPLISVLHSMSSNHGFRVNILNKDVPITSASDNRRASNIWTGIRTRIYHYALRGRELVRAVKANNLRRRSQIDYSLLDDLRILFVGGINSEWHEVVDILRNAKRTKLNLIKWSYNLPESLLVEMDSHPFGRGACSWATCFDQSILDMSQGKVYRIDATAPWIDDSEIQVISKLFDEWIARKKRQPAIEISGINLVPAITEHLRRLVSNGPSLVRHADLVADQVFTIVQPDAVCFAGINYLVDRRLVHKCRQREIPIIGIQHGGSVGTLNHVGHEYNDFGLADSILTYGEGIRPRTNPNVPVRAGLIPVGSRSLERRRLRCIRSSKRKLNRIIKVLWLSDTSFANTRTYEFREEDTRRYCMQKRCLEILMGAPTLHITFRPLPGSSRYLGTPAWLECQQHPRIRVDENHSLDKLLCEADVVITDSASSTVWNEAIAFGKPVILYCNLSCTPLMHHFVSDVEQTFYWCRNEMEFTAAMDRLATQGTEFVTELQKIETSAFLENYVLHRDDGQCAQRIISALSTVSRNQRFIAI